MSISTALPTIDQEALQELAMIMEDAFPELLSAFLVDGSVIVAAIQEALSRDDLAEVSKLAHTLKGSSANVGALALSDLCQQLNSNEREGVPVNLDAAVTSIVQEFERFSDELTRFQQGLGR